MPTIEQSVEVNVPVSTAYDRWTQFEEFPTFMDGVKEVRRLDDTHLHWVVEKVGSAIGQDDRAVKSDLERFKELVESHGTTPDAGRGAS